MTVIGAIVCIIVIVIDTIYFGWDLYNKINHPEEMEKEEWRHK